MKRSLLLSNLALLGALTVAGVARADNYTNWITIVNLEALADEMVVYTSGVPNDLTNNPASCTGGTSRYYVHTASTTPEGRELMSKTLLSAFLAGRKVQLYVESAATGRCYQVGSTTYATYHRVQLNKDN
jgi:hypothetical protein